MEQKQNSKIKPGADAVALYHIIYEHEGFEESAQNLFKLVQQAQSLSPGKKRKLYIDIEGHRVMTTGGAGGLITPYKGIVTDTP